MGKARSKLARNFENSFKKEQLKKQLKVSFSKEKFKKPIKYNKLLKDIKYLPLDVIEMLAILFPDSIDEVHNLINSHLELNSRANNVEFRTYDFGKAKSTFSNAGKT